MQAILDSQCSGYRLKMLRLARETVKAFVTILREQRF
jgi:hypothetical protein